MDTDERFGESISRWLEQSAPGQLPDRVLEATFEQTRGSRQDVGWRAPRWRTDSARSALALGSASVVVLVAALTFNFAIVPGIGGVLSSADAASPTADQSSEPSRDPSGADVTALLEDFLEARVAGAGAQPYLNVPEADVPLLYATTSGARYERAEFEPVSGVEWPYALTGFQVRLFAGDTVVEQLFFTDPDGPGLEYQPDGFATDIAPTTEDGRPEAAAHTYFDGEVTLHAAHPWVFHDGFAGGRLIPEGPGVPPTTDGGERNDWDQLVLMADPLDTDCQRGPGTADARALAEKIRSNPNIHATAPITVSTRAGEALMMDVVVAAGKWICAFVDPGGNALDLGVMSPVFDNSGAGGYVVGGGVHSGGANGDLMRLYLFDAPEGSSMRILVVAVVGPASTFERAVEAAAPVIDSIEFHAP